jgi:hypothetical protein
VRENLNEGSWQLTESEGDEKQREIREKLMKPKNDQRTGMGI